jgi:CubicO group peptidase (beta-lactamase class C family)
MRIVLLSLCALFVADSRVAAANDAVSADLAAAIEKVSERLVVAAGEGASGVLRIHYGDAVLIESGFGSASCTTNEDVTSGHLFMIGSITKEFTRLLGYVLEEEGVLSLDSTVSDVLPGFRGPAGRVTLQQLMDHTGGLPDLVDRDGHAVRYTVEYDYEPVTRGELIARAGRAELLAEPGENEQYSNLGYQLLAAIYEVATGDTYPDLLRRYIYGPARMRDTDFRFPDSEQRAIADGCRADDEHWGNPIDDDMWGESGPSWNLMGAGGLLSTAESLGRFLEGIGDGVYFDDPAQLEKYKSSRMVFSKRRQQRVMGPAGSNGIFNAVAFWADDDRFAAILMTNRADHAAEDGLIQDILAYFPPAVFATRHE